MKDLIRDSIIGQQINYLSGGRLLPYADQRPGYQIPQRYLSHTLSRVSTATIKVAEEQKKISPSYPSSTYPSTSATRCATPIPILPGDKEQIERVEQETVDVEEADRRLREVKHDGETKPKPAANRDAEKGDLRVEVRSVKEVEMEPVVDPFLVDWDGPEDPDNPRNWSPFKRGFVAFSIALLTFSVYIGSAIYTSSIPGLMSEFGIPQVIGSLGLTLYVLAYGIGPMFLTPLQELPSLGRNPVYIFGLILFLLFNIPIAKATNMSTVLAFRFLTGFVGSPALATGGASMADIFEGHRLSYMIGIWSLGAVAGPILGPVIGGFAAQAKDWRWPIYELMWISAFAILFLSFLLPETYEATILLKRARRLRKLTGNTQLRSQSEIDQAAMSKREIAYESLVRPFVLSMEPAVLFLNMYLGLVYSVFYLWFEAFPLVFNEIYHMNLGVGSLPFLGFVVSGSATYTAYCLYLKYYLHPRLDKNPDLPPEIRLYIGLIASIFIPVSLLIFGWASRASVHWIVPVIAAALYLPGIFLTFQSILIYLSNSYKKYTGSILAGNDLFRSTMASVFPLFGAPFFKNLGLGPGSSLLAGISILLIVVFYLLIRFGGKLRARSKYAESN
ncbi:benomyl methotrexate resistance protein [Moniliophthora roreri MCA 2997]|uniref:Benomyl methotrexate resistance protein n=2 Tax=Moniliophthora roreri TaxID=221103 RepID=V2XSE5_MONRO|nr:benomyl methotrexate resistance protein [Moniliophthora roreri MCA 2997]KAI3618166.1 benomyl methotrexate resistance protein [Moniliophthora roreri]